VRAGAVEMEFTGIRELDKAFSEMNQSLQKKALRPATRAVAKLTLEQARAEVPEDTGMLASELRIKAKKRSRRYPQTVGMTVGFADDLFKGDTFYAGFMEFGTAERQHKSGKRVGKIDDTRFTFLRSSLWTFTEQKVAVFRRKITEWMNQQKAKGAK
jgi:HK97 gp10 family phage protein